MQKGKERYYKKSKMWMGDILIINKNTLYFLGHQPNRTQPHPTVNWRPFYLTGGLTNFKDKIKMILWWWDHVLYEVTWGPPFSAFIFYFLFWACDHLFASRASTTPIWTFKFFFTISPFLLFSFILQRWKFFFSIWSMLLFDVLITAIRPVPGRLQNPG